MYASWVPHSKRTWEHRQELIKERLLNAEADIVCIQEADGETFETDFDFMIQQGYKVCLPSSQRGEKFK